MNTAILLRKPIKMFPHTSQPAKPVIWTKPKSTAAAERLMIASEPGSR
jgi:hypothetical protein